LTEQQKLLTDEHGLKALDVLKRQGTAWCLDPLLSAQRGAVTLSAKHADELINKQVHTVFYSYCNMPLSQGADMCMAAGHTLRQ